MGATLEAVCRQMVAAGLPDISPHELRLDAGRWTRYGPGKKAFYKLVSYTTRTNQLLVSYGTFGIGSITLKVEPDPEISERLSAEDYAEMRRVAEARQREEAAAAAEAAHLAANRAKDQWGKADESGTSPYLTRKRVARPEGVRFIRSGNFAGWIILLLWHYGRGEVVGSQKIAPEKQDDDGDKRFNKGMAMEGAALRLGDEPTDGDLILIGEGYATVASAREALNYQHPVYMACNANNLVHVARILRSLYPASPFVFLADDDYLPKKDGTPNHTGRIKAEEAAQLVGNARVVLPVFSVPRRAGRDDLTLPQLTDFNDLHAAEGTEAVSVQLRAVIDGTAHSASAALEGAVDEPANGVDLHAAEGTEASCVPDCAGESGTAASPSPLDAPLPDVADARPVDASGQDSPSPPLPDVADARPVDASGQDSP
ncbi:hypothetical protein, partial [Chitinimonas taiwanensis]|uniref:hypothetical protein n=1 Tax=Chitinimonas taiwanensis TaxID=240412 RepID=UPI00404025AF